MEMNQVYITLVTYEKMVNKSESKQISTLYNHIYIYDAYVQTVWSSESSAFHLRKRARYDARFDDFSRVELRGCPIIPARRCNITEKALTLWLCQIAIENGHL